MKKIISLTLAALLIFSILPVQAIAAEVIASGITVQYGGLSYVNQVLRYSASGEALVNAVKALFTYNQMAENYFN